MARSILVDAGFLVALLSDRDARHRWAVTQAPLLPLPWKTCDAVLTEAFFVLGAHGVQGLTGLLRRGAVLSVFHLGDEVEEVLTLMQKYANVPMSFADACLVRMTEALTDPVLLTTDADFRVYRRHSRQIIPCIMPS
jgi:predicted nucleic acid-binding protein